MPKTHVIDLYRLDNVESFAEVRDSGVVACIHKATEGRSFVDTRYASRRVVAVKAGLKWGAYHFFHGNADVEADHFLQIAEPDDDTVLALDWETTPGDYTPTADQAKRFLQIVEAKIGRKVVVYSGHAAKDKIRGKDEYFGSHRLWLAQYASHYTVQESWDEPWLWQFGSEITKSRVPGVSGYCDVNQIVGQSVEDFVKSWSSTGA